MNCPLCGKDIENQNFEELIYYCPNKECPGSEHGFNYVIDCEGVGYLREIV